VNDTELLELTSAWLLRLVNDRVHEGRSLDYKRDLIGGKDEDKREFARDVSSFANAAGGAMIFGVEEAKDDQGKNLGYPAKVHGVACPNFDQTKLWLESVLRDHVDPRVQGMEITKVDGFERGPAIVLRIPRSWSGPHMVTFSNQTHFYSRNSAGKQPLDVREIRAAFLANTEIARGIQRFRDGRLAAIIAGETPVPLTDSDGRARMIVHVVPVATDKALDLAGIGKGSPHLPPLGHGGGWSSRYNLDGLVTYCGPNEGPSRAQRAYSQIFRSGAIEGVYVIWFGDKTTPLRMYATSHEGDVAEGVEAYVTVLRKLGADGPLSVLVSLVGVRGTRIAHGRFEDPRRREAEFDRDVVALPDIVLTSSAPDVRSALRPVFDAMWQASGWERSFGYDAQGNWDEAAHR
jgi:hypothetical protein